MSGSFPARAGFPADSAGGASPIARGGRGRPARIAVRRAAGDQRSYDSRQNRPPGTMLAAGSGRTQPFPRAWRAAAGAAAGWRGTGPAGGKRRCRCAAARRLFPRRDELSNSIRRLSRCLAAASAFFAAVVSMRPGSFRGRPAEPRPMRAALGTETLLVDLRREMTDHLQFLPSPVGFGPPGRRGTSQTGPPARLDPCFRGAVRARKGGRAHRSPEQRGKPP